MERLKNLYRKLSKRIKIIIPILLTLTVLPLTFQEQIQQKLQNTPLGTWMEEKGFDWIKKANELDNRMSYGSLVPLKEDEGGNPTDENSPFKIWLHSVLNAL